MKRKLSCLLFALCNISSVIATSLDNSDFYQLPANAKVGQHGSIIKALPIKTSVPNARAWKVLYWSYGTNNSKLVPVSAIVVAPLKTSKSTPIVTWAHGTTGLATSCAPSMPINPAQDFNSYYSPNNYGAIDYGIPSLTNMINSGYVVAATDYVGLGVKSKDTVYFIGEAEAKNVLDAAIAAKHLTKSSANTIAFGWSQGGHAALWTADFANYASHAINLLGVVALSPANPTEEIKMMEGAIVSGYKIPSLAISEMLMGWYTFEHAYSNIKLSDRITKNWVNFLNQAVDSQCVNHMSDSITFFENNNHKILVDKIKNDKLWYASYQKNALEQINTKVPFAIYQGEIDATVPKYATDKYINYACNKNIQLVYKTYSNTDHIAIIQASEKDYLEWIRDRFAGKVAPNNCSSIKK